MNSATLSALGDGSDATTRVQALRTLLAEKFPTAERRPAGVLPTGLPALDRTEGGLRRGSVTEVSGSLGAGSLFLAAALALLGREKCFAALVDAGGSFDPQGCHTATLRRLLWVRCAEATLAVKATDLLLRDGNLALVLLDVQMLPLRALGRIPASTWHRLQRVVEQSSTACVVLTPQPMVEGARVRIALPQRWPLAALRQRRRALLAGLEARVFLRTRTLDCADSSALCGRADLSAAGEPVAEAGFLLPKARTSPRSPKLRSA